MPVQSNGLPFENKIVQLETELKNLERTSDKSAESEEQIRQLRRQLTEFIREAYSNLTPWETVQVARHKERPQTANYLDLVFDEYVELHGDRHYGDDRALRAGFAKIDQFKVMVVGHHKGKNLKERSECFFWVCTARRVSKSVAENEIGGEIWYADHLFDRHSRSLSWGWCRGTWTSTSDRGKHV